MTIAKITSLESTGSFDSSYGTMFSFRVSFDDGIVGSANAKTETAPYKVGDTVGYTVTGDFRGTPKLKIEKNPKPTGAVQQPSAKANSGHPEAIGTPVAHVTPVNGPQAGMGVKTALETLCRDMAHDEIVEAIQRPSFHQSVYELASDLIRIQHKLEKGELARSVKERANNSAPKAATPVAEDEIPF